MNISTVASSMGCTVENVDQPCDWQKGIKPFYVSDKTKMRFYCQERYRIYADRVEGYLPTLREKAQFSKNGVVKGPFAELLLIADDTCTSACQAGEVQAELVWSFQRLCL